MTRTISILGATGSIGASTLDLVRRERDKWRVVALTANCQAQELARLACEFGAELAVVADEACLPGLRSALAGSGIAAAGGAAALVEAAARGADMTVAAIVGCAGLAPTMAAIECGKTVALANKEALVSAGDVMTAAVARSGAVLLPVDSEHNAIWQCFEGKANHEVRNLWLTASGGPFRKLPKKDFSKITLKDALKHPTWNMGNKITIDSASLMNKGLEMIEARWLFDVPMSRIEVVVHPQSIVHSMVEFSDNSVIAQLSHSDMCFPIQYAVTWPERVPNNLRPLDFAKLASLTFEAPRTQDFPALNLARHAGEVGGTLPAVLNAANEVAVEAFLQERSSFPDIWRTVERVMGSHQVIQHPGLEALVEADAWARREAAAA